MKWLYFLFVLLTFLNRTTAQNNDLSDIYTRLPELNDDTLKLKLLYQIAETEPNALKSEPYHKKGLEICFRLLESGNNAKIKVAMIYLPKFIINEGYFATLHKNNAYALKYTFYAQELALRTGDSVVLELAYNNIACILIRTKEKDISFKYFDTALVLSEKLKNYGEIANVINSALTSYDYDQDMESRLQLVKKGLNYLTKYENRSSIAEIYNNLGLLQFLNNDSVSAKVSFDKALAIAKDLENPDFEITTYFYLGRMYNHFNLLNKSENFYLIGYNLAISNKDVAFQDKFSYDMAKLYQRMGKKNLADKYAKGRVIDTTVASGNNPNLLSVNLAEFYQQKRLFADSVFKLGRFNGTQDVSVPGASRWLYIIAGSIVLCVLFWWLKNRMV